MIDRNYIPPDFDENRSAGIQREILDLSQILSEAEFILSLNRVAIDHRDARSLSRRKYITFFEQFSSLPLPPRHQLQLSYLTSIHASLSLESR